jgi:hypothetical protein
MAVPPQRAPGIHQGDPERSSNSRQNGRSFSPQEIGARRGLTVHRLTEGRWVDEERMDMDESSPCRPESNL